MINYLAGNLSPAERQLVDERKRMDTKLRARADRLTTIWNLPPVDPEPAVETEADVTSTLDDTATATDRSPYCLEGPRLSRYVTSST